ncbi:hypothetical protein A5320_04780 [Rheinheimera sp. SA_1]|uniref:GIN domain-containing protein n=1 Tax=Rheinheimera sp. SA_1 TaxID=1827365 RepID=UPI00080074DA|nr:DUF2807 domain-containing protein [Rheinheimera sp. SA_1]OBP16704.1 hypothetical protein A5320_04780 [Rheinheimera sp. SA_1]
MRIINLALLAVLALPQTSCSVFAFHTEEREVSQFKSIDISGLAEVFITNAKTQGIVVKVSGMPISDVITRVDEGTLVVSTNGYHSGESVKVYVNYVQLNSIHIAGSAEVTGTNTLVADDLLLTTGDSGDIKNLEIKADHLTVRINDSGNADLNVDVLTLDVLMNDAGDLSIQGKAKTQNIRSNSSRGTLNNANLNY